MKERTFRTEVWVPHSAEALFDFFGNASNLDHITPPWLHFKILTPEVKIQRGARIEYRLKWHGIPMHWISEITEWDPPYRFVDEQAKGPYARWIHEHRFIVENGGTRIVDKVRYGVRGWILEPLIHNLLVGPDVRRIFDFRTKKISTLKFII